MQQFTALQQIRTNMDVLPDPIPDVEFTKSDTTITANIPNHADMPYRCIEMLSGGNGPVLARSGQMQAPYAYSTPVTLSGLTPDTEYTVRAHRNSEALDDIPVPEGV